MRSPRAADNRIWSRCKACVIRSAAHIPALALIFIVMFFVFSAIYLGHLLPYTIYEDKKHVQSNAAFDFGRGEHEFENDYDAMWTGHLEPRIASNDGRSDMNLASDLFSCDRSHTRFDACRVRGDARVKGGSTYTCTLYTSDDTLHRMEMIQPYPRKWEQGSMQFVQNVTLQGEDVSSWKANGTHPCDVQHEQPAIIFSAGGYSGNIYHDFNDVLIPLFISSVSYKREVVLLITDMHDWWFKRYDNILKQHTNHDIIDLRMDERLHCFTDLTLGLPVHGELQINPDLMPRRESIREFQKQLALAFRKNLSNGEEQLSLQIFTDHEHAKPPKPKLLIIDRLQSRVIVNEADVVNVAKDIGFHVGVLIPTMEIDLSAIYHVLQSADVMLGVHGAALTHFLFMKPGCVFIQVIPIGIDSPAAEFFGEPAVKLGLKYLSYRVRPEESTLTNMYNSTDPIIRDSDSIAAQSWEVRKSTYMERQDVKLSPARLGGTLNLARVMTL